MVTSFFHLLSFFASAVRRTLVAVSISLLNPDAFLIEYPSIKIPHPSSAYTQLVITAWDDTTWDSLATNSPAKVVAPSTGYPRNHFEVLLGLDMQPMITGAKLSPLFKNLTSVKAIEVYMVKTKISPYSSFRSDGSSKSNCLRNIFELSLIHSATFGLTTSCLRRDPPRRSACALLFFSNCLS